MGLSESRQMSLPQYPYSHIFLRDGTIHNIPMGVHMRFSAKLPGGGGVVNEVLTGIDEVKPDVYYLLSNTLVTHWKPIQDPSKDDLLISLAGLCWVSILPLKNYVKSKQNPYTPPIILGWRKRADRDVEIEGGILNPNCFASRPKLIALRVTLKKQKGSILERKRGMLDVATAIHLALFEETEHTDKPDWVTTPILMGNFKIDKKRHTTAATWLTFPQRAVAVQTALIDKFSDLVKVVEVSCDY